MEILSAIKRVREQAPPELNSAARFYRAQVDRESPVQLSWSFVADGKSLLQPPSQPGANACLLVRARLPQGRINNLSGIAGSDSRFEGRLDVAFDAITRDVSITAGSEDHG